MIVGLTNVAPFLLFLPWSQWEILKEDIRFMRASALILADSGVTITPSDCTHTLVSLLTAFVHLKFWGKPNKSSSLEPKSSVYIKRTAQRIQLSPRKH